MPKIIIDIPDSLASKLTRLIYSGKLAPDNFAASDCDLNMDDFFAKLLADPRTITADSRIFTMEPQNYSRHSGLPSLKLVERDERFIGFTVSQKLFAQVTAFASLREESVEEYARGGTVAVVESDRDGLAAVEPSPEAR